MVMWSASKDACDFFDFPKVSKSFIPRGRAQSFSWYQSSTLCVTYGLRSSVTMGKKLQRHRRLARHKERVEPFVFWGLHGSLKGQDPWATTRETWRTSSGENQAAWESKRGPGWCHREMSVLPGTKSGWSALCSTPIGFISINCHINAFLVSGFISPSKIL